MTHVLRNAVASDQGYVGATWTRSLLSQHVSERHPEMRTWPEISKAIDAVMERPETRVLVCCAQHDRRMILAWICYAVGVGAPVVHYLYVRQTAQMPNGPQAMRGRGISHALLKHLGVERTTAVVCTSLGPSSRDMRSRYLASSYLPLTEYLGGKP